MYLYMYMYMYIERTRTSWDIIFRIVCCGVFLATVKFLSHMYDTVIAAARYLYNQ